MAAPQPGERAQNIPLGIVLMLGGIFMFAANDALGKWLAGSYAAPQIVLFRSLAALAVLTPPIMRIGWRALVNVHRPRLQIVRATIGAIEIAMFYWAVAYLPLADAMTYYLAGPIYVTIFAAVFLHERVGWRRWTAVVVGFLGVVVALGPSASSFGWAVLIPLTGSVLYAIFVTTTRVLRGTPDVVMAAWQIGFALVIGIIGAPFAWRPIASWEHVALLLLLGIVSLAAIIAVNRSLAIAPASVVVPYQYTMIIWAMFFGYIVFGDTPSPQMIAGAGIIIAAGLFIFFREQRAGIEAQVEVPPDR